MTRDPSELVCQELVELVTEYLGQALPPEDRVRVEKHLLTCPPCTAYLAQIRTTVDLAGGLAQAGPPRAGEVDADLLAAFRRWARK